eukprot:4356971-Prymnesium_polylepis.3
MKLSLNLLENISRSSRSWKIFLGAHEVGLLQGAVHASFHLFEANAADTMVVTCANGLEAFLLKARTCLNIAEPKKDDVDLSHFYEMEYSRSRRQSEINEEAVKVRLSPFPQARLPARSNSEDVNRGRGTRLDRQATFAACLIQELFYDPRAKALDPDRHPRPELEPHSSVDATPTTKQVVVAEEDADLASFYEMDRRSSRRQSEINEEAVKVGLSFLPRRTATNVSALARPRAARPHALSAVVIQHAPHSLVSQALFYDPRAKELDPDRHPRPELEPHNHVDAVLGFFSGLLAPKAAADDTDLAHFYEQEHSKSRRQSEINEEAVKVRRESDRQPRRRTQACSEPHSRVTSTLCGRCTPPPSRPAQSPLDLPCRRRRLSTTRVRRSSTPSATRAPTLSPTWTLSAPHPRRGRARASCAERWPQKANRSVVTMLASGQGSLHTDPVRSRFVRPRISLCDLCVLL